MVCVHDRVAAEFATCKYHCKVNQEVWLITSFKHSRISIQKRVFKYCQLIACKSRLNYYYSMLHLHTHLNAPVAIFSLSS